MQTYELQTLPQVRFAHVYSAGSYLNTFSIRTHQMEISYISEGSLTVVCDGKEYVAGKGDVICLPYYPHRFAVRADAYHEHHTVMAQVEWTVREGINGLYLPVVTPAHLNTKPVKDVIDRLVHDQLLFKESPTRGAAVFLELLCEIDRCNNKEKRLHLPSRELYTQRAKEYIHNHIHLPITQKEIAEHLSITSEYLCFVFKKTEGMSVIKYINMEKMQAMRELMEEKDLKLYEAAALFGYGDPNYVSRLFKKYYGYNITEKQNRYPQ